jgi:hypothetical protein
MESRAGSLEQNNTRDYYIDYYRERDIVVSYITKNKER